MTDRFRPDRPAPSGAIDVTVLFATRNRAEQLEQTLRHLGALIAPDFGWELIVVDNGSTDATPEVLARAADQLPLVALREAAPGKNRALNFGLPYATGRLVVFTDDDVIPDPEWLRELVRAAGEWTGYDIFAGRITPRFPADTSGWIREHRFGEAAFAHFQLEQGEGPTEALAFGPNFCVRANVVRQHQFSEGIGPQAGRSYPMGSETEYLLRLQRAGHHTVYVPTARVEHVIQASQLVPEWLLGRSYRLGRGLTRLGLANPPRPPRLLGVPRHLLPVIARTWLRYRLSPLLGRRRHFDIALEYQFLLGSLYELRLMAREESAK